jgi:CheY-like chemotaxis protein/nitrogen-specific signal transduction histidine kinase
MARARTKQRRKPLRRRARRRGVTQSARSVPAGALPVFAHDIRTSLTGILALGELLASSNLGERERQWASDIKTSAEHLAALTTLMVDAAKADDLTLQQKVFRPRRLIEALGETLAVRAQTKGLRAAVKIADGLPERLIGDAVRLRAALENLIDNAVKFTAQGSVELEVRANPAGRGRAQLHCIVRDSGIGLTRAEIRRLFRPFAQASADIARRFGGAGLGLSVVKILAKRMGGNLTVTSTPGRGSTFHFSAALPIGPAEAHETAPARQSAIPARRLKILCAEDNPYGRVILNTILTELGHRVDFVESGEQAVAAAARGYDAILMDVTLTGIDGLEATRRVRALGGKLGATPIIGISGHSEPGDREAALTTGMNVYLHKPLSPSMLREAIAAAVGGV